MRYALSALALVACSKTATQKTCDVLFDRIEACSKPMSSMMRHSADEYCEITLGYNDPSDTTSLAARARDTLVECGAITACEPLLACLSKHECVVLTSTRNATAPQFQCMH